MILDIFAELQRPRPWGAQEERTVYLEAIEQAKLADALGFGCLWVVEHHGAGEFSLCSAPDLLLLAIAQHTERLRLGHAGVLAPFKINHPLRIAERAAFLDVMSGGRLELGLARSAGMEWDTFGVDPAASRAELEEALRMLPKMWAQPTFHWQSERIQVPEREVLPRPFQKPHPRLWQTAATEEGFELAGQLGVGVLGNTLMQPLAQVAHLLDRYARGRANARPVSEVVNSQRALFTFMHCAETRRQAIASRAALAALWFMNAAPKVFQTPRKTWLDLIRGRVPDSDPTAMRSRKGPEHEERGDLDDPVAVIALLNRLHAGQPVDPEHAHEVLESMDGVIIGDVEHCRRKLRAHAEIGADRLMCLMQFGALAHEDVLNSIRVAGEALIPEFGS